MTVPRFRLRTLMIAVATAGLLAGGVVLKRRSDDFRATAERMARDERTFSYYAEHVRRIAADSERIVGEYSSEMARRSGAERLLLWSGRAVFTNQADRTRSDAVRASAQVEWFAQMKLKYRRAAARPWLSVPPDPPRPS